MQHNKTLSILIILIVLASTAASLTGIFSNEGKGGYEYKSIRGEIVTIYGKGLYKDMSAEVAPQGIAQDHITLFLGIPVLLISFFANRKGSLFGRYILTGSLAYFLVTYLFYTVMAMYNVMFLCYVLLTFASFYSFLIVLLSFDTQKLPLSFSTKTPVKATGTFLILNAVLIALLWLSIIVPPLISGSFIPEQTEHYTTLVVQGLDLGILLPAAAITGALFIKRRPLGYLLAPVYFVFLSLLMSALTAKVIAMGMLGYNIIPVVFIIPSLMIISVVCTISILRHIINNRNKEG